MATEEEHACLRKLRYHSRKRARDVARRNQASAGARLHAYRCPFGRPAHWHIGHAWRDRVVTSTAR